MTEAKRHFHIAHWYDIQADIMLARRRKNLEESYQTSLKY